MIPSQTVTTFRLIANDDTDGGEYFTSESAREALQIAREDETQGRTWNVLVVETTTRMWLMGETYQDRRPD